MESIEHMLVAHEARKAHGLMLRGGRQPDGAGD